MEFLEYLRPAFKAAILPPGSMLLLLLLGLLLGRRILGRLLTWLALVGFYLSTTGAATVWLAQYVETYPPQSTAQLQLEQVQAILLLTAGATTKNPELDDRSTPDALSLQRLSYALKLYRETGLPIVITGGKMKGQEEPLAQIFARWLHERTGVEPLALETQSITTWENLANSSALLEELGIQRVALVTHAFHMQRAMLAADVHGVDAVAAPLGFFGSKPARPADYRDSSLWVPDARQLERNYLMLHELLGTFWYQLKR